LQGSLELVEELQGEFLDKLLVTDCNSKALDAILLHA
jgi:hypothetical protein